VSLPRQRTSSCKKLWPYSPCGLRRLIGPIISPQGLDFIGALTFSSLRMKKKPVLRSPSASQETLDLCLAIVSSLDNSSDILRIKFFLEREGPAPSEAALICSSLFLICLSCLLTEPNSSRFQDCNLFLRLPREA
jgi:hypothetical protein